MNLIETGNFIKEQRKQLNLTQLELAQKLNVSEKTISKWETGKGFPDTSIILELCNVLNINANELLSAKKLNNDAYIENAENNLIELKSQYENITKHLFVMEWVIGYISSISFLVLVYVASYISMPTYARVILILLGLFNFLIGMFFCIKIEKDAGYYKCKKCNHKYIPTYKSVLFSMHFGRTRYMKCPKCHKHSWQNKTINK